MSRLSAFSASRFDDSDYRGAQALAGELEHYIAQRVASAARETLREIVEELNTLGHHLKERASPDSLAVNFEDAVADGLYITYDPLTAVTVFPRNQDT